MKTLMCIAAAALFASPAFAADVVKDSSGAWSCQRNGEVISYYWPLGRVPSQAEQTTCAQANGSIVKPKTDLTKKKALPPEKTKMVQP